MPIDQATIARLRDLLAKATPGPWFGQYEYDSSRTICSMRGADLFHINQCADSPPPRGYERTKENAELITAMLAALPALIEAAKRLNRLEVAVVELLDTMETCHVCGAVLLLDEGPVHCENCSYDCEDHEAPDCVPIFQLHANVRRILRDQGDTEVAGKGEHGEE